MKLTRYSPKSKNLNNAKFSNTWIKERKGSNVRKECRNTYKVAAIDYPIDGDYVDDSKEILKVLQVEEDDDDEEEAEENL